MHSDSSKAERARAAMLRIWEQARPSLLGEIDDIDKATSALIEGRLDEDLRAAGERAAHKLAGSAGTFGFHRASEVASDLEVLLASGTDIDPGSGRRAAGRAAELRRELDAPVPASAARSAARSAAPPSVDKPLLLVVCRDGELAEGIRAAAASRGVRHRGASDLTSAWQAIDESPPDVVLLDLSLSDRDGLTLLAELDTITPRVPVLVLTGGGDFIDRVEAARAGAAAFLPISLPAGQMVEAALASSKRSLEASGRLLAVDDDPAMLAALTGLFEEHPLRLTTLSDPLKFWEVLEETSPDLLLLDLDMPTVGGLELCRLIRADSRWESLPVLVLTASSTPETIQQVFAAGADDFVGKPVVGPELLTRVTNRVDRVRLYRQMAETDPLTGLANRRKFESEVRRLQAMASRYKQPLSFALLDLDRFKRVNDQHGHATGDVVLQRLAEVLTGHFRAEDVVSRWGGEEIALAMYGMNREDGVGRVVAALELFREESLPTPDGTPLHVTFSAGVGQFGVDGDELHELYHRADEVLYAAKSIGGDRVLPVGWQPRAEDGLVDAVVVDDDAACAPG